MLTSSHTLTARLLPLLGGALLIAGCQGEQSSQALGPDQVSPGQPPSQTPGLTPPGMDTPTPEIVPTYSYLRRLTARQYENTVLHALGDMVRPQDMPDFQDGITLIGLASDPAGLNIDDSNAASLYSATGRIAQAAIEGDAQLGACAKAQDDVCLGESLERLAPLVWRRPLASQERDELEGHMADVAAQGGDRVDQLTFLLQALLAHPAALYRSEMGQPQGDGTFALGPWEVASALSYSLWNAPPDAPLMQAAADDKLGQHEAIVAQLRRMRKDPKAAQAMAEFMIDYLKLEVVLTKDKAEFLRLTPVVRRALLEGVRRDLVELFEQPDAALLSPFELTDFYVNKHTAPLFGVQSDSEEFEKTSMPPSERFGMLSHPAFLIVHGAVSSSGIVQRGVFTLEQLLCRHLGNAPDDISGVEPPEGFDANTVTAREELHVLHSSQPACAGCHQSIDPAGAGYENYDAAGRWRLTERDDVQIDASGPLRLGREQLEYSNSVDYLGAISRATTMHRCVSDHFASYVLGQKPLRAEADLIFEAFEQSKGRVDIMTERVLTSPSFRVRREQKEASNAH